MRSSISQVFFAAPKSWPNKLPALHPGGTELWSVHWSGQQALADGPIQGVGSLSGTDGCLFIRFFFQMGYVWNRVLFSCDDFISGFMPEMQVDLPYYVTLRVQHDPRFPGGSRVVHRFQVHTNGNFQEVESLLDSNRFFFCSNKNGELSMDSFGQMFFFCTFHFTQDSFWANVFFCIPST